MNMLTFEEHIRIIKQTNSSLFPIANNLSDFIINRFTEFNGYEYIINTDFKQINKNVVHAKYNITDISDDDIYNYVKSVKTVIISELKHNYDIEKIHSNLRRITFLQELLIILIIPIVIFVCIIIVYFSRKKDSISSCC